MDNSLPRNDIMIAPAFLSETKRRKIKKGIIEPWMIRILNENGNCYVGTNINKKKLVDELATYDLKANIKVIPTTKDCILELAKKEKS